ncbi:MAG: hypothetical protein R8L53_07690 [Mariprofundales bacterium]
MIRILFMTLLAFFGPIILMFLFRNIGTMLVWWLKQRVYAKKQAKQDNIIDITPPTLPERKPPPLWYIFISIALATIIAFSFWQQLQEAPNINNTQHYVPAHSDSYGNIIPSHYTNE